MEVANRCNFDCVFCPSGISERPRQNMDRDAAFSLLALRPRSKTSSYFLGEITLNNKKTAKLFLNAYLVQSQQAFLAGEAVAAGCEHCGAIKNI